MLSGKEYKGKVFIDATYEGDFLAIDEDIPVQEVAYEKLKPLLLAGKQVLEN